MNGSWVLIMTKPGAEKTTAARLSELDHPCLLPMIFRRISGRGSTYDRIETAFPRYLFVWTIKGWKYLAGVKGVSHVVTTGDYPAFVPQTIIDELMGRLDTSGVLQPPEPEEFEPGQKVRTGSITGVFECKAGGDRVRVLLSILGSTRSVEMSAIGLEAA